MVFMASICDGTVEVYRCDRLMCDVSVRQVSVHPTFWERSRLEDQDHVTRHTRERVSSKAIRTVVFEVASHILPYEQRWTGFRSHEAHQYIW